MPYKIIWSLQSEQTYFKILEYLLDKWTEREAQKFENRLEEVLEYVQKTPRIYRYSKEINSYRAVLTEQITLTYRLKGENIIELITFWDTRQDPEKLKS